MKTILALFLAVTTLASAQVRTEPPKEVSLRNARVTSKEFKEAYAEVERKLGNDKLQEVGPDGMAAVVSTQKSKENPTGAFLTEKDFYNRLKKGEKFSVTKISMEKCSECKGKKAKDCASCKGRGETILNQTITYTW